MLENAVKDFQHFAGIELTGKLDALTLELIKLPRCGVKDNTGGEQASRRRRRKRRYTLEGSRWKERRLTWAVTEYPRNQKLTNEQVPWLNGQSHEIFYTQFFPPNSFS